MVPGYSRYEVSEIGELRCVHPTPTRKAGRVEPHFNQGYRQFSLVNDEGKAKVEGAHRLVAYAFLPPRQPGQRLVRHLNGLRRCNHPSNLSWGTHRENSGDELRHSYNAAARLTVEQVADILAADGLDREVANRLRISILAVQAVRKEAWEAGKAA